MPVESILLSTLSELAIAWEMHEHQAVFTVEESAELHTRIPGAHTKNMFLKDAGGQFWLITMPHDIRADLKALPELIGSRKLSFGKAEDMGRLLGISPGSVTPLAAINDTGGAVKLVLDVRLVADERVNVHPLRNTATMGLPGPQLIAFLDHVGHPPLIILVPAA